MKKLRLLVYMFVILSFTLSACAGSIGPAGPEGPVGRDGRDGSIGPAGPEGPAADPMELLANADFLRQVKEALDSPSLLNPYMDAYQATLEYEVPDALRVPNDLLAGFDPVESLVKTNLVFPNGLTTVQVPPAPNDLSLWKCFPQDYSEGDSFNPGCKADQLAGNLPWNTPIAGFNAGENWSCDSPNGWCADDIQAQNWRVEIGFELCHPAVGCLKDPQGGAVMILFFNFHDSDEVWGPRNSSAVYVDSGYQGYGVMWDLKGDSYDIGKGIGDIRNHFLYQLSSPVGDDNRYRGQCGDSGLCETVTYVVIGRVWDRPEIDIEYSHFELLDFGQWTRP